MTTYPLTTLHFAVTWDDAEGTTSFSEANGLAAEWENVEYRGGADPQLSTRKQPGLQKFSDVTLTRGIAPAETGLGLFTWYQEATSGSLVRRNVTISLLNEVGQAAMIWKIKEAWPVKLEIGALKSTGNEVAVETCVFTHEGLACELGSA